MGIHHENRLSIAFNHAIDPMWLIRVEGPSGFRFEAVNAAFTKVTGWTVEQVVGQPIEKIMPEASHELVRAKYNEALQSGKIIDYVEEARHPKGVRYGEIRVIPIPALDGEPMRILGIANDITEKVSLQKKLDEERELKSRQITSAAIRGQETERSKVSRELHDNVNQVLTTIKLNQVLTTIKLYVELVRDQKVDADEFLSRCANLLGDTIDEIRGLSKQLSVPSLGKINFKETLTELVESLRSSAQVEVIIDWDGLSFHDMENELHLALYRVTQEQFTNIIKYASANEVKFSLTEEDSVLHLTIVDNGVGFDPSQKSQGIGITNMQSRVETLNGSFEISSQPGQGTELSVEIPVIIAEDVCYAEQTVFSRVN